jgi:hypothetical protein
MRSRLIGLGVTQNSFKCVSCTTAESIGATLSTATKIVATLSI